MRIVEGERVAGAEVNAVGFIGDTKDVFALSGVGFRSSSGVDVGGVLEAFELDFAGIRGRQVRVKGASDSLILRRRHGNYSASRIRIRVILWPWQIGGRWLRRR